MLVLAVGPVLTMIGLAMISVSRAGALSLRQSQNWSEAQLLASSAVEHAIARINSDANWRTDFNGQTVQQSMGNGSFSWQLTDVTGNGLSNTPISPILIHATGTVGTSTYSIQVHCTIPQTIPYDLMTTGSITVKSGASIDSFDSTQGAYGGTNVGSNAAVATNSTSNNAVTVSGSTINGSVSIGVGGNPSKVVSGSSNITGTESALSQALTMPTGPSHRA